MALEAKSLPFNNSKGCPEGFHKRASYTSKNGHRVPPRCVKSTTVYNESRKNYTQRVLAKQESRLKSIGKSATAKLHCPPGKIERHGYVRRFGKSILNKGYTVKRTHGKEYRIYPEKSSVYVKPSCVKDRGLPGTVAPGQGFGPLRRGELKKHGYVFKEPEHERHEALNKAVKEFGPLGVFHKLDAIAKLAKRTAPEASKVFKEDLKWLMSKHKIGSQ
jgi:Family of unknown function (DUF5771)